MATLKIRSSKTKYFTVERCLRPHGPAVESAWIICSTSDCITFSLWFCFMKAATRTNLTFGFAVSRQETTSEAYQKYQRKTCTPFSPKPAQTVPEHTCSWRSCLLGDFNVCVLCSGVCPGEDVAPGPWLQGERVRGARAPLLQRVQRRGGGDGGPALRPDPGQHRPAAGPVEA